MNTAQLPCVSTKRCRQRVPAGADQAQRGRTPGCCSPCRVQGIWETSCGRQGPPGWGLHFTRQLGFRHAQHRCWHARERARACAQEHAGDYSTDVPPLRTARSRRAMAPRGQPHRRGRRPARVHARRVRRADCRLRLLSTVAMCGTLFCWSSSSFPCHAAAALFGARQVVCFAWHS